MGSACTPCVRPIMGVCSNSWARARTAALRARTSSRTSVKASLIRRLRAVSTTSEEVSPWCSQRPSSPTFSATFETKAMTSCWTSRSMASMRATSKRARARMASSASGGTTPRSARTSVAASSTRSQVANLLSSDQMRAISGCE